MNSNLQRERFCNVLSNILSDELSRISLFSSSAINHQRIERITQEQTLQNTKKKRGLQSSLFFQCCHQIYLLELYHELFKSKCLRLSKNNLNKLIKILDPHSLNYNFENFYSLLQRKKGVSSPFFVVCLLYLQIKALFGILEQIFQVLR